MNDIIVIRQRFPNFICDGAPYGHPHAEPYYRRIEKPEEFHDIDWVKEKVEIGCLGWFITGDNQIMAVYEDPDGGTYACHAILEEGELDMDVYDFNVKGTYAKIMEKYNLPINPKYDT